MEITIIEKNNGEKELTKRKKKCVDNSSNRAKCKKDIIRAGDNKTKKPNSSIPWYTIPFGQSSYLADQHRSFYDRDFGADRYVFEAYDDDCCYCDDGNDDDDDSYGYSDDGCNDYCGDSGDNSWRGAGD